MLMFITECYYAATNTNGEWSSWRIVWPNVVEDLGTEYVVAKVAQPTVKQKNNFVTLKTVYLNLNSEV